MGLMTGLGSILTGSRLLSLLFASVPPRSKLPILTAYPHSKSKAVTNDMYLQ